MRLEFKDRCRRRAGAGGVVGGWPPPQTQPLGSWAPGPSLPETRHGQGPLSAAHAPSFTKETNQQDVSSRVYEARRCEPLPYPTHPAPTAATRATPWSQHLPACPPPGPPEPRFMAGWAVQGQVQRFTHLMVVLELRSF